MQKYYPYGGYALSVDAIFFCAGQNLSTAAAIFKNCIYIKNVLIDGAITFLIPNKVLHLQQY